MQSKALGEAVLEGVHLYVPRVSGSSTDKRVRQTRYAYGCRSC